MLKETPTLEEYLRATASPEHPYLAQLVRATYVHLLRPRMASGHEQGVLLKLLMALLKPKRVLEIGTFSGYSALAMASGMDADAEIFTLEANDEQEDFTRPWLEGSPFPPTIHFLIGTAQKIVPTLEGEFDVCFIDANKREYIDYYELVLPRLRPGGLLLADNTLWDGHVVDADYKNDAQTRAILQFNAHVATDPRTEQLILPLRDGLSIIYKKV